MASCPGTTKKGAPCKAKPLHDTGRCNAHSPADVQTATGFGGPQPGSGRPRTPRAVDVIRERIEADVDAILTPLFEALAADRAIVVGGGEAAYVERVPDHGTRIAAARELLDRAYGRPKQQTELSGPDGGPVETRRELADMDIGDPDVRYHIHEALRRSAKMHLRDRPGVTGNPPPDAQRDDATHLAAAETA